MESITAIKHLAKPAGRSAIHVGGRRIAVLDDKRVHELDLRIGLPCDEQQLARLRQAEAEDNALRDAFRMLRRRDYASQEIAERLGRRDHSQGAIAFAVERLIDRGLINDETYGRALIAAELSRRPAGQRLLVHKLIARRLPRPLAERLAAEIEEARDPLDDARRLAEQRLRTPALQRSDAVTRRRRLWGLLGRRGFEPDVIQAALDGLSGLRDDDGD